ncbi:photosystem reaction center subunit H [Bacillus lacus]|uniref:Photosystem reaction center subunit H n=1 Tax=Metabacillus lacus TaxID=1983721 RepID=A0A7X2IXJ4_9BACI|nr:PRC-barrel domain-containing protein [Metabacillus lacus]MRX71439.1 photosystem reaction center subunit H [Metabacillus lacus]
MKKSTEIIGLPIINISEGSEAGSVKSLVINPDKGTVDFLTVEHEEWQVSIKAVPFRKVVGIGEFAVTIDSDHAIIDLNEIPIANQLVNKRIRITDTKVITKKGQLLGAATEYFIDDESGQIIGIQLKLAERDVYLKAAHILTFGKDILIVQEDAEAKIAENLEDLVKEGSGEDESVSVEQKQVDLLFGNKLLRDIHSKDGSLLIQQGAVLSYDDIQKALNDGPGTFVELSMNTEV